jgi:hypothetical protein
VWTSAEELSEAITGFIEYYNQRWDHEGFGNVAPADVYYGRREEILKRREEQKRQTVSDRFEYNHAQRKTVHLLSAQNPGTQALGDTMTGTTKMGELNASNCS